MQNTRLIFSNLWRLGTLLSESSESPQFPSEYSQEDDTTLRWRSRNGTGTGNGLFVIGATNKYIDFDEGGAELTATLTEASYTGTSLAAHVKAVMDAAGGTYTVTYSESTGKFTIARAAGNFTLRWQSGTNTANTAGTTLGFIVSANDTGADTYTSDYARFHYPNEYIIVDLGVATAYDYVALLGHNLSASATVTIYGADDAAITSNVVSDSLTYNANNMRTYLAAARTKRYVKLVISDPANSSGYVEVGTVVLGSYADLGAIPDAEDYEDGFDDFTVTEYSPSRNLFITQDAPAMRSMALFWPRLTDTVKGYILDLLETCGAHFAFEVCTDYTAPNSNTRWMVLAEVARPVYVHRNYWTWAVELQEHV